MSKIVNAGIKLIHANPHRQLDSYPFVEKKIESLMRSINDVGFWEGVIARKKGRGYEIAFGHHRIEAARRLKLKTVPLVVRELTDEQMLQFMGRENLEDYNADFLVMLETWDAAVKFARDHAQTTDIARILGWTYKEPRRSEDRANDSERSTA